ncbi:MAG: hypothetical protein SOR67_05175, partial [Alloprevotella sp.]|nr:hypothetical protein [Alloprevotella sp.]
CLKRGTRFKQKRPACGGFQYCQRGGWPSLVGAGGSALCRLALPDRICIRFSLCSKRVPRFKQNRPACGGNLLPLWLFLKFEILRLCRLLILLVK